MQKNGVFQKNLLQVRKLNEYQGFHNLPFVNKVGFMKQNAPDIKVSFNGKSER